MTGLFLLQKKTNIASWEKTSSSLNRVYFYRRSRQCYVWVRVREKIVLGESAWMMLAYLVVVGQGEAVHKLWVSYQALNVLLTYTHKCTPRF